MVQNSELLTPRVGSFLNVGIVGFSKPSMQIQQYALIVWRSLPVFMPIV